MQLLLSLSKFSQQPLTTQVLLGLLNKYKRPYDKIVELVHKGYLLQLRRGLYVVSDLISPVASEPFLIANHLYGPSYVSVDTALHHWGLIPERVFEVTSVTPKSPKKIVSADRIYSYTHLPMGYYPLGIRQVALTETQVILMACQEKSLCDKIITTSNLQLRSKTQAMQYLIEELRINHQNLKQLDLSEMENWLTVCPKKNSIENLLKALKNLK